MPASLEELVDLIGKSREQMLRDFPGVVFNMDQVSTAASLELDATFSLDLNDPEVAFVAASVATYIINKGREEAKCVHATTGLEAVRMLRGMQDAVAGIGAAVYDRHRGGDS